MTNFSKTVLISLGIILVGIILFFVFTNNDDNNEEVDDSPVVVPTEELESTSSDTGYSFQYPDTSGSSYVSMTDWPPTLQVIKEPLDCTQAGMPEDRAGQTQQKQIGNRVFCVTEVAEGAAGSVYYQYAYATEIDSSTFIYTFTVREPQCQNYDEPENNACMQEQAAFSPDEIATTLVETTVPQSAPNSFSWSCPNDYQFQVTYKGEDNASALLELPETSYELQVARSGSGARYANEDESVVFWEHQGEAVIEIDDETIAENCTVESESVRFAQ